VIIKIQVAFSTSKQTDPIRAGKQRLYRELISSSQGFGSVVGG